MNWYLEHRMFVDFSILLVIIVTVIMIFFGKRINQEEGNAPRIFVVLLAAGLSGFLVSFFSKTMFFYWLFYIISN